MDESPPFPFEPVPLRSRRDGWMAERQRAFVDLIRSGLKPGRAASRVGMRRQGAYALRARSGAKGFAAAWDAAAAAAHCRRIADRSSSGLYARAVDGIPTPIRYRRKIVAVERRYDIAALIRLLGMLALTERIPVNGGGESFSPMDAETLSAFAPGATTGANGAEPSGHAIAGGEITTHPLEDVRPSKPPE